MWYYVDTAVKRRLVIFSSAVLTQYLLLEYATI